ncbi:MAG TPA: TIGR03435 family protein [Acidobacteriaceae bacterium]|nr:TIGR03435 family protein [Acidobacteriaceae bacterium]
MAILAGVLAARAQDTAVEPAKPMAKNADPSFEVAAIKPSDPNDPSDGFHLSGRHVTVENQTMTSLICFAYAIDKSQIINAPKWFDEQHWDIDGVPDVEGMPDLHQYQRMVEKVLASRFGLQLHHEQRELSGYTLRVTKGGPKIQKSKSDPDAGVDQTGNGNGSQRYMKFTNSSMPDFILCLEQLAGKPVRNDTNLPGRFDFLLRWTPNELRTTDPNAPPGLLTAIQEELGLKLEADRGPTDVLVIDAVTQPTQN